MWKLRRVVLWLVERITGFKKYRKKVEDMKRNFKEGGSTREVMSFWRAVSGVVSHGSSHSEGLTAL